MANTIAVIDYGMGNLRSVAKAVEHVAEGARVLITDNPDHIQSADRIVFPGQGAAAECMSALHQHDLLGVIGECAHTKPFLGICMGMQVLMSHSAENGGVDCLGIVEGDVIPFENEMACTGLKIPHMGWNNVNQSDHVLWGGIEDNARFYFVHSYFVKPLSSDVIQGQCEYGINFTAAIGRDNIFAVQCHPEKSADVGLQLLSNFVAWRV